MNRKIFFVLTLAITLLPLCSCTSENSETLLMCEKIAVDTTPDGYFSATAIYKSGNAEKEEVTEKSFVCADENQLLNALLSADQNVLYTPLKAIYIGKNLDINKSLNLLRALLNSTQFNLKCRVFECDNAKVSLYQEPSRSEGKLLGEYYRHKANF